MNNPVGWFEIYVDEMQRAKGFYEAMLGLTLEVLEDPTDSGTEMLMFPANMEGYGATGALVKMEGMSAGGNGTMIYFSCDDCSIEESRVEDAGGSIQQSKFSIGEFGFCTLAMDSEGNMFGLHSEK